MILLELASQHNLTVSNIVEQWFFKKLPCLSEKKITLLLTQLMNEFIEDLIDTRGYKKQSMKMKARKFQFYIIQYFVQSGTKLSDQFRQLMLVQADLLLDDRSTKFFRYVQLISKSNFQQIFDEIIYLHDLEDRKNNLQGEEKSQYKQIFKTEYLEMMLKQNQEAVLYSDHSQFVYQIGEKPKPTNQQIQKKQIQTKNGRLIVRKPKVLFPAHDVLQFREELEEESELDDDIINAFSDMVARSKQSG